MAYSGVFSYCSGAPPRSLSSFESLRTTLSLVERSLGRRRFRSGPLVTAIRYSQNTMSMLHDFSYV